MLKQQIIKRKKPAVITFTVLPLVLAGSFLVNHFFFNTAQEAGAWYSDNWLYRQGIPIENSGAERTDYQVAVTVDTSTPIAAGKMQSMCQDIRFTSKITGKELPYWIESGCDSGSTKIWVNVDKLPFSASSTYATVDMYYGNPTAPTGQNGDETFLLFDDFGNDIDKWKSFVKGTGGTTAVQTDATVQLSPTNGSVSSANIRSNTTFTNGISIEARRKQDSDSYYLDLSLGDNYIQDAAGNQTEWQQTRLGGGYFWWCDATANCNISHAANDATSTQLLASDVDISGDFSNYQRFQYRYDSSGELWWLIDDTLKTSATNTTYLSTSKYLLFSQGEHSAGNGDAQNIDWVFVRKYDEQTTEPSMGTAQAEEQGKGAVGYWKFDEGYGSITYDSSGQGNHGTITGATWKNEEECPSGKCLYFDDNQYSDLGDVGQLEFSSGDFSVGAWIKLKEAVDGSPVDNYEIASNETNLTSGWMFRVGNGSAAVAGRLYLRTSQASASTDAQSAPGAVASDNKWHHAAVVVEGGAATFYVDGVAIPLADTGVITSPAAGSTTFRLGGRSQEMEGHMDEVKIYPYARSAAEVKADYLEGLKGGTASIGKSDGQGLNDGLIGHWKMDEVGGWDGTANEVVDASGAGNHGVRSGDATTTSTAKYGMAGDFDGTGDYVTVGDIGDIKTVSFWVNNSNTTDGILELIDDDTYISIASSVITATNFTSPTIYVDGVETTAISSGWHHVVVITDTAISAASVIIGEANTDETTGHIDDVRVYNRALSEHEALQLYETGPPPVLHLKMDENTGTTAYDSVGNTNGTVSGAAWLSAGECRFGGCLDFDGVVDDVQIADTTNSVYDITGELTTMTWVKVDDFNNANGNSSPRILEKSNKYGFYLNTTGGVIFRTNGTSGLDDTSSATIADNEWVHVVGTYSISESSKKIYINGILDTSLTRTGEITTDDTYLGIGDTSGIDRFLDGKIDDVRIYNYALSAKQIAQAMQAGAPATSNRVGGGNGVSSGNPVSPGGPVLYYKFDDLHMATTSEYSNTRAIVKDQSGRGNHGEVYNATSTPGKFGKALGFDGAADRVVAYDDTSLKPAEISFSVWVYANAVSSWDTVMMKANGSWAGYGLAHFNSSDNAFNFFVNAYSGEGAVSAEIELKRWTHIVGTYDLSNLKLYIDGELVATKAYSTAISHVTNPFTIGTAEGASLSYGFDGKIDEVKMYPYALTEDEIKVDYNKGKALLVAPPENPTVTASGAHPGGSAPLLHLTFDEKTGTTSTDRTGNGNDAGLGEGTTTPTWRGSGYCIKGGCLEFDGTDDYADVGVKSSLNMGDTFTASVWAKAEELTNNDVVMAQVGGTAGWMFYWFNDLIYFFVYNYADDSVSVSGGLPLDEWTHLVGTSDSTETCIYINGIKKDCDNKEAGSYAHPSTNGLWFGAYGASDDNNKDAWFKGLIDEAKVWDRVLTPAEIAYEYDGGKPVGHWKLDEGDGDWAYDSSGNGNHGVVVIGTGGDNAATSTAWQNGATGQINGALDFDGTDDFVSIADDVSQRATTTTFSAWVYPDTLSTWDNLFMKTTDGNWDDGYGFFYYSVNGLRFFVNTWNGTGVVDAPINTGEWSHIVGTYDGTNLKLYINGELAHSKPYTNSIVHATDVLTIGTDIVEQYFFDGQIDDVRIYNYARSSSQIKIDYNNGKALYFK